MRTERFLRSARVEDFLAYCIKNGEKMVAVFLFNSANLYYLYSTMNYKSNQ